MFFPLFKNHFQFRKSVSCTTEDLSHDFWDLLLLTKEKYITFWMQQFLCHVILSQFHCLIITNIFIKSFFPSKKNKTEKGCFDRNICTFDFICLIKWKEVDNNLCYVMYEFLYSSLIKVIYHIGHFCLKETLLQFIKKKERKVFSNWYICKLCFTKLRFYKYVKLKIVTDDT